MKNDRFNSTVKMWFLSLNQYRHETSGFKTELSALSDQDLFPGIKFVSGWMLDFAPHIFNVTKPKYHPELRRAIAYLADLQERQIAAMVRENERFARQWKEQRQVLQILQRLGMTNQEKINLVKNHYGWA